MKLYKTVQKYLNYCELQKGLDKKTIKGYRIDLKQSGPPCVRKLKLKKVSA